MYKEYFLLSEMPFSIAPDPRFLFMSARHREAMAHLLYGMQGDGGIVLLTGEVGTGKTTLCRSLLEQLPRNVDMAFILNPRMNVRELLQAICEEFHINMSPGRPGIKTLVDALNAHLLSANAQGRRAILMVDEAQNLGPLVIEQLRLLTNLETSARKLLQIFLIGQPELQAMLSRLEMRQVSQRIIAHYHLSHLNQSEVHAYIEHRLHVSGASPLIFSKSLTKRIYRASGGIPRLINLICDRAMLGAYVQGKSYVTLPILRQATSEVFAAKPNKQHTWAIAAGLMIIAAGIAVLLARQYDNAAWLNKWYASVPSTPPAAPAPAPAPKPVVSVPPHEATENAPQPIPLPPLSTLKWPDGIARSDSEILAFQSLFKLYGIAIDNQSRENPCQQAEALGMRCYSGHGGLSELIQLDQPALMRLSSPDGKEYSATLTALDPQTATLTIAGISQRVPLNDLANSWFGRYVVIWKVPPDFNGSLSLNQHGPAVSWLRHAMEIVDGIRDNGSDLFDADLAQRIRSLQLSEGIQPDGVVGPLTTILLNVRSGKGVPHLVMGKKG